MNMQVNNAGFEVVACPRCGGSGEYSYNPMSGSRCFKCNGAKVVLSKRGSAARAFFMSLLDRPAKDVKPGELLFKAVGISGPLAWCRVDGVRSIEDPYTGTKLDLEISRKGRSMSYRVSPDSVVRSAVNQEEITAKILQAVEYQGTLNKLGKPAKKSQKQQEPASEIV